MIVFGSSRSGQSPDRLIARTVEGVAAQVSKQPSFYKKNDEGKNPHLPVDCPEEYSSVHRSNALQATPQTYLFKDTDMTNTTAKLEVLTPENSQIIFIDHQPQMAFGVQSIDRQTLKNNVVGLAKGAKAFDIPTIITTVETESFSGYTYPELLDVFPEKKVLERTSMNSWDDQKVRDQLAANGRKKVIVAGLWTEVCNTTFALCAMLEGEYEIYMVSDASGGTSKEAHDMAMQRMIQAGVVPVTWQQVLLEWQRDWARRDSYDAVMEIVKEHSGAYGMGVDYAYTMVHKAAQRTQTKHEAIAPVAAPVIAR